MRRNPNRTDGKYGRGSCLDRTAPFQGARASTPTRPACDMTGRVSAGSPDRSPRHGSQTSPMAGRGGPGFDWSIRSRGTDGRRGRGQRGAVCPMTDPGSPDGRPATSRSMDRWCSRMCAAMSRGNEPRRNCALSPSMAASESRSRRRHTTRVRAERAGRVLCPVWHGAVDLRTDRRESSRRGRTWRPDWASCPSSWRRPSMSLSCTNYTADRGM